MKGNHGETIFTVLSRYGSGATIVGCSVGIDVGINSYIISRGGTV